MAQKSDIVTKNETLSAAAESAEYQRTRALILATAESHFKRYGYSKTTIIEIAKDSAMSHANVYRFFRNKADLADAVGATWIRKLVSIAHDASLAPAPPEQRLIDVVTRLYTAKRDEFLQTRYVHEIFLQAARAGRSVAQTYQAEIEAVLAEIVSDGIGSGVFRDRDASAVARAFHAALAKYFHPVLVEQYADTDNEAELRLLLDLLINGLR